MTEPLQLAINAAIAMARTSPCGKSKRGAAIWEGSVVLAAGRNAQPTGFECEHSKRCEDACAKLCEHAEEHALRVLGGLIALPRSLELLHIKVVDGEPKVSGPPSCWQCSRKILADGRIGGVWLLHDAGWTRYLPEAFHLLTLETCELPETR